MKKTYLINFEIVFVNGEKESRKCKMKNSESSIHAQIKLENHLKATISNFKQLVVISCQEDLMSSIFGNNTSMNDMFGDIFNGFNKK